MTSRLPEETLRSAAERRSRDGWIVLTYTTRSYLSKVLNWSIAADRAGVENSVIVALDRDVFEFLHDRGFATVLVPTGGALKDIRMARVRVSEFLVGHGYSLIQSDADAVWLRDPREFFEGTSASIVASQGTYWPLESYRAWGFVLCTGLFSLRPGAAVGALLDRWLADLEETGSDQQSLHRVLMADGVTWNTGSSNRQVRRFRNRDFHTFEATVEGHCPRNGLGLRLLPHALFQRVPVPAPSPHVVHYLPDLAGLPETQALTETGSWFLANGWRRIAFDAGTLDRISVRRRGEKAQKVEAGTWRRPVVARIVD